MLFKKKIFLITFLIFISISNYCHTEDEISIQGIEPNGGPSYGETRVLVRLKNFNSDLITTYPHPSCRFGSSQFTVLGTYTKCTPRPRKPGERQPSTVEKTEICIQCEDSPRHDDDIVPFTVSLLGDFTDTLNSIPFRYYVEPTITYISPRSGPKDGNTRIDVYGEGFLNFDQNLRCGFGSKEVKGIFISQNHIQCVSPFSSIVQRELPFSISLNNQQNTKEDIPYVYYENPTIYKIEPINRGPDSGGSVIRLRGANFNPFKELQDLKLENETYCYFESLGIRPAKIHSSTEIECVTPPSYEKLVVPVEITLNNQQWTDDNVLFYYYHPPYTYYISPKIGPVSGGTIVQVMGGNFEDTGTVKCKFGDKLGKGKFISKNELQCISPEVEKPCIVPLRVATRDEEYSSGINTKYTYYDTPIIHYIEPECGPSTGYTQITVYGQNFPFGYSNQVKCLFNGEIKTNATIISYNELKCDSPPLPTKPGSEEMTITSYSFNILVNDDDKSGPEQTFYYYKSPVISGISPIMGGIDGDTTVKISGSGFNQPEACNITTRFSTYHAKPLLVEDNYMVVKSPQANYTGSVVVQVSLNGQQFGNDITYNFRDQQNTFYYYKCPIVSGIHPDEGPSVGGNDISIYGVGFLEPFFALGKENGLKGSLYDGKIEKEIFYRFVDFSDDAIVYGDVKSIILDEDATTQKIVLKSPSIIDSSNYRGRNHIKTIIQLSYDGENFCDYDNIIYTFFNLPNIIDISPKYAPLEAKDQQIELKLDNLNCNGRDDCSRGIKCRFTSTKKGSNKEFIMEGTFEEINKIKCDAPNVNIPEEFNIEASINGGDDYTNNNFNYTYYDPFVLKVEPQMLSDKGNTEVKITGYGFANTGSSMKVMFGDSDQETVTCSGTKCLTEVEYVDSTILNTISKPRKDIIDKATGQPIDHYKKIPVEVAIYNDDFTNNKVSVFYYEDPKIINDIDSTSGEALHLTPYSKAQLKESLVDSIPCNLDTFIPIPVDGSTIERHLDEINNYAKYTCLFEVNGKKRITDGVYTKFPLNNTIHNLFLCQSPKFVNEVSDSATIRISLNGYDFSNDYYKIALTDPVNVYKIVPACGPIEGGTNVKIYGTGFQDSEKAVFKWGPQNLVPMNSKSFFDKTNEQTSQEILYDMQKYLALNNPEENLEREELLESLEDVEIQKIIVNAPHAPNDNVQLKTRGGPDYISVSKSNLLPLDDFLKEYYANNFIHTNFEYYYYRQIYIEGFFPSGSISTGGATVMVIGAWFQYKPEYGLKPYCKFGDKVVEGEYLSTVRIICEAPPSDKEFLKVPFYVSLNGEDWVEAEKPFRYHGDFKNAQFDLIEPDSGPTSGGTHVKIYGKGFTAIFDENELLCQFEPVNTIEEIDENGNKIYKELKARMEPINVPARLSSPSRERKQPNENEEEEEDQEIYEEGAYIECQTPSGWPKGTKTNVKIAFDGQTFLDTKQNFYFFQIDDIIPSAGPNSGEGNIEFLGGGFEQDENITLIMNKGHYKPLNATEQELEFDIPSMPGNYTGYVDMDVYLNGVDEIEFKDGFYYYQQPTIDSIYPKTGPSTGKTIFHVFGKDFRDDFRGAKTVCKVGSCIGKGEIISEKEMKCYFENLPVEHVEFTEKEDGTKIKSGNPIQIALNGVTFTKKNPKISINTYSIEEISPVSGPIETGTIIVVKGSGFIKSENIRCRFGVPGYFAYTEGTFIDYNKITCPSPKNFNIPNGGGLPFTVPFSIAFNDDEFNPWTQTSHVFTFYKTPDVVIITPKEVNTTSIVPIYLKADDEEQQFFSMPLASIKEDEYQVLNKDGDHIREVKKTVKEQSIMCRFGKYGVTEAEFLNETDLSCLTPKFQDDNNDIIYEEVPIEVAPNGIDYLDAGKINLKGQEAKSAGCMYCILAILGILFLAALAALIGYMCSKKMIGINQEISNEPHTQNRNLRYLQKPPDDLSPE